VPSGELISLKAEATYCFIQDKNKVNTIFIHVGINESATNYCIYEEQAGPLAKVTRKIWK
jgi:hypothetical protein